jgi:hypothetical protein
MQLRGQPKGHKETTTMNARLLTVDAALEQLRRDAGIRLAAPKHIATGVACSPLQRSRSSQLQVDPSSCLTSDCRDMLFPLVATAVAASGTGTISVTAQVSMCVESMLIITTGASGFTVADFRINNQPQWLLGGVFHSAIFAPGGDANTAFKGDCLMPGSTVSIDYVNLDGAAAQSIYIALKGPGA